MKIVTFDFDHTLKFETGDTNEEGLAFLREHVELGDEVHIVSSRCVSNPFMRLEIEQFVEEHSLSVEGIHLTDGKRKLETLQGLGAVKHFDDDDEEIEELPKHGIEAVLVFDPEKWEEHMNSL